jgi:sphinganine C4-monooxygenase
VPYSFATNYNHPLEGFFNDILDAFISSRFTGLTEREAMVFFCTAQVKAVDDHSSMDIPWNPLRLFGIIFGNNMVYHTVHHQTWVLKVSRVNFYLIFPFS